MKKMLLLPVLLCCFWLQEGGAQETQTDSVPEPKPMTEADAQSQYATPKSMWEVSATGGGLLVTGDVSPQFSPAGGISVRKATDYLFSLRFDALYGQAEATDGGRSFTNDWISVGGAAVFSLNALKFDRPYKTFNLYALVGGGGNYFQVEFSNEENRMGELEREIAPHATVGAGIAYRVNKRVNIGLEYQGMALFGSRSDRVDGSNLEGESDFRDIIHYPHLRVNYNIGNPQKRSEPLYWINPLEVVLDEMTNNQKRAEVAIKDTDGDGVIDQLDQEPETDVGALVDTKGRTLDSDRDGIPDHKDKEPFYTPREGEQINEEGVVINASGGRGGVTEARVRELIDEALQNYETQGGAGPGGGNRMAGLFLPMLHFGVNSATIKYSDYGNLSGIAQLMKNDPQLKLVVTGYTDQTGTESLNQVLSYKRAKAVINHLVNNHGIERERLILQYGGESQALVPQGSNYMNRRVEFSIAKPADVEMEPPEGYSGDGTSGY